MTALMAAILEDAGCMRRWKWWCMTAGSKDGGRMDIRLETCLIVRREGMYLRGRRLVTGELMWSDSPYDAWRTRRKPDAQRVAGRIGGSLMLFNPIVGQTRRVTIDG